MATAKMAADLNMDLTDPSVVEFLDTFFEFVPKPGTAELLKTADKAAAVALQTVNVDLAIQAAEEASAMATPYVKPATKVPMVTTFVNRDNLIVGGTTIVGAGVGYYLTKDEDTPVTVLGTVAGAGVGFLAGKVLTSIL